MAVENIDEINEPNRWRLESPGHSGWKRTARPNDPDKYLMISADCHCNEPSNLWVERIDRKFRDRLPRIEVDENGVKWSISEGWARSRLLDNRLEGEDHVRSKAGADPEQRLKDQIRDGVDAEVIFPNKGLTMWATPDATLRTRNAGSTTTGRGKRSRSTTTACRRSPRSRPPICPALSQKSSASPSWDFAA